MLKPLKLAVGKLLKLIAPLNKPVTIGKSIAPSNFIVQRSRALSFHVEPPSCLNVVGLTHGAVVMRRKCYQINLEASVLGDE